MADDLFTNLKTALQSLKDFLDANVGTLQPTLAALRSMLPEQVDGMLDGTIELLTALKGKLQAVDVASLAGLEETAELAAGIDVLLGSIGPLLPEMAPNVETVGESAGVIASLQSLAAVKADILVLIDGVVSHLGAADLSAAPARICPRR